MQMPICFENSLLDLRFEGDSSLEELAGGLLKQCALRCEETEDLAQRSLTNGTMKTAFRNMFTVNS
eukprot:2900302-Amphidinium_carterae.1